MTDAREIIARHLCTMAAQGWPGISAFERAAYRTTAAGIVEAINASGIRFAGPDDRILGPDEFDPVEKALEQALDLLNSSLREMAPISAENHRKRVIEFIANARALGRKA